MNVNLNNIYDLYKDKPIFSQNTNLSVSSDIAEISQDIKSGNFAQADGIGANSIYLSFNNHTVNMRLSDEAVSKLKDVFNESDFHKISATETALTGDAAHYVAGWYDDVINARGYLKDGHKQDSQHIKAFSAANVITGAFVSYLNVYQASALLNQDPEQISTPTNVKIDTAISNSIEADANTDGVLTWGEGSLHKAHKIAPKIAERALKEGYLEDLVKFADIFDGLADLRDENDPDAPTDYFKAREYFALKFADNLIQSGVLDEGAVLNLQLPDFLKNDLFDGIGEDPLKDLNEQEHKKVKKALKALAELPRISAELASGGKDALKPEDIKQLDAIMLSAERLEQLKSPASKQNKEQIEKVEQAKDAVLNELTAQENIYDKLV